MVDDKLPTEEGKQIQTSQESSSTSNRPRSKQAALKNVACQEGFPSLRIPKVVLLSVGIVQNSAVGMRGRISARECRI